MSHTAAVLEEAPCRWESGELGDSIPHARAVSTAHAAAVDEALGLQAVDIRLPKQLLDDLDLIASEQGLARPALIRRVLAQFVAAQLAEEVI